MMPGDGSYPPRATDHNYPCQTHRSVHRQHEGAHEPLRLRRADARPTHRPHGSSPSRASTPAPSGSRSGAPRAFTVSPDGSRVVFLRSRSGTDRANLLWVLDSTGRAGRRSGSPPTRGALLGGRGGGAVARGAGAPRAQPRGVGRASSATRWTRPSSWRPSPCPGGCSSAELRAGDGPRTAACRARSIDPRPSPDGRHIAYVARRRAARRPARTATGDRALAEPEDEHVTYGLAEFIAAEEMDRSRGFWWSPDGGPAAGRPGRRRARTALVDRRPRAPGPGSRPRSRTRRRARPTPRCGSFLLGLDGAPYGGRVGPGALSRTSPGCTGRPAGRRCCSSRPGTSAASCTWRWTRRPGATRTVHVDEDPVWLELFPGVPAWTPDGRLVRIADEGGARVLMVGDRHADRRRAAACGRCSTSARTTSWSPASAGAEAAEPETGEIHVVPGRTSCGDRARSREAVGECTRRCAPAAR